MDSQQSQFEQINLFFKPLGQIQALVLTSFGLDISYLEKYILPAFFPDLGDGPSDEPHRPLFEYLEEFYTPISVLYDADNLISGEQKLEMASSVTRELRWQSYPVVSQNGFFHPKVILALVEIEGLSNLVVGCSSANLTRQGWGRNFEACVLKSIKLEPSLKNSLLMDTYDLVKSLLKQASSSIALEKIKKAISKVQPDYIPTRKYQTAYRERLWFGQDKMGLAEWLEWQFFQNDLSKDGWKLEILSPYYSNPLPQFISWAQNNFEQDKEDNYKNKILCYCPMKDDQFDIDYDIVQAVDNLPGVQWAKIKGDNLRSKISDEEGRALSRFLHAKVYRFWTKQTEVLIVGSANATTQGNRDNGKGNFEASMIFSRSAEDGTEFKPWLIPHKESISQDLCVESPSNEDSGKGDSKMPRIHISFDWSTNLLQAENKDKSQVCIYLGAGLNRLTCIEPSSRYEARLEKTHVDALFRNSVVKLTSSSNPDFVHLYLVEETNLHEKPPAPLMERNVDDLIRDWQSGSEQRLSDRIARAGLPDDLRQSTNLSDYDEADDVARDRLNDLFLAFSKFTGEMKIKLAHPRQLSDFEKLQIESRLFGKGAMSIRYFAERITKNSDVLDTEREMDFVESFIGLLTIKDTLSQLEPGIRKLKKSEDYSILSKEMQSLIKETRKLVKNQLENETGDKQKSKQLIHWVEQNFRHTRATAGF